MASNDYAEMLEAGRRAVVSSNIGYIRYAPQYLRRQIS